MDITNSEFKAIIKEYRDVAEGCTRPEAWMDWRSDVYVNGTWSCVKIADAHLKAKSRVLDFGCGLGLITVLLSKYGHEVTGTDIDIGGQYQKVSMTFDAAWGSLQDELDDPEMLSRCWEALAARFGNSFAAFDGRNLPFPEGSFNGVVAHAVLEHISPEARIEAIAEIKRVLVDRGTFFVFRTPRRDAYLERAAALLGLPVHDTTFSDEEIVEMMRGYGFTCVWSGVTDMVPSFPPKGLSLYNRISHVMILLDDALLRTRLKRFAHHVAMVFEKTGP